MAEPIRRNAPPVHRRPPGVRPHPRPRPVPWVADETEPSLLPRLQRARPAAPEPPQTRPAPPAPIEPATPVDAVPSGPEPPEAIRTRTFQPVPEKKLRTFLQTALGLHIAALLLTFLSASNAANAANSAPSPGLSDTLLAVAVLLAGGTVLALGASSRRG
jgi:hypothetical protein